jgi:hypothetical protein
VLLNLKLDNVVSKQKGLAQDNKALNETALGNDHTELSQRSVKNGKENVEIQRGSFSQRSIIQP